AEIAMPDVKGRHQERSVNHFTPAQNAAGTTRLRSASSHSVRRYVHNLALAAFDQRTHVILPQRQRVAHFALVTGPVVDARWSALVPGLMVEDLVDDVRRHADVGHLGGGAAPEIVRGPVADPGALIERGLAPVPGGEATACAASE